MSTLEVLNDQLHATSLPTGWRMARLGDVCDINPIRPADLSRADDEPTSFVPMDAVDAISGTISKPLLRRFGEIKKGYTCFAEGDVLFAKITPCMQNGKHAIARGLTGGIGFGTTEFHVLRPSAWVLAEWIHFLIRQPELLNKATEQFTGAVGQQRLPPGYLQDYPIPLPPLPEQKRIAAILKEQMVVVEKARAAAQARLEAARSLPAAFLRQVFPQPGQPLHDGWRWVRLGEVCDINPIRPADLSRADYEPTSFVPMDAVDAISGTISKPLLRRFGEIKKGYTCFAEGDVLFAKITPCMQNGKHAIARGLTDGIGFGTTEFHVLRPSGSVSAEWVHFFVRQPEFLNKATEHFTGAVGQQRLPSSYLQDYPIPLPLLPEQKRIAATLKEQMAAVEKARAAAQAELGTITALPAALLRRAFKGEL